MKRIYSSEDRFSIYRLKDVFENEGIECLIKNERLAGAVGEVPPIECWLEIWISEEEQYELAEGILEKTLAVLSKEAPQEPKWECPNPKCNESHEQQFNECWNCGTKQPKKPELKKPELEKPVM